MEGPDYPARERMRKPYGQNAEGLVLSTEPQSRKGQQRKPRGRKKALFNTNRTRGKEKETEQRRPFYAAKQRKEW